MTTDAVERDYARLLVRLRLFRCRAVLVDLVEAGALALAAGMTVLWLGLILEALVHLPSPQRIVVPAAAVLALLAVAAGYLVRRLPGSLSLRRLGLRVEGRCPQLRQGLITALELGPRPVEQTRYSVELLAAATASATRAVESMPPGIAVGRVRWARCIRYPAAAVLLLGGSVAWSGSMAQALWRSVHPLTAYVREPRTRVSLTPGDVTVVRGADLAAVARFSGELPTLARVLRREEGATTWQGEELVTSGADSLTYLFRQIRRPFAYEVRAGDGASGPRTVRLIDPPAIQRVTLRYRYPEYTGLPVRLEEDGGDVRAVRGTRVELELEASKPLGQATLVLDDTVRVPARIEGSRARTELEVRRPGRYRVEVVDTGGLAGLDPISHTVEPVDDEPPRVALVAPGRDQDLPESMKVLLEIEADDDYGVSVLWLVHRVNDGPEERQRLSGTGRQVRLKQVWDLSATELLPEDRVRYRVEALDNDAVSGPKRAATREYVLRFPSLYQLYEETARQREESLDRLEELSAEGRTTEKYLEQARRELLRTEELSWEQRKELEANLARETERAGAVEELARTLGETLQELERNGLNSAALLEKIAEIRELMAQVVSAELREALARVQAALEQEDPQALAEALRELSEDQQSFQERLDRTIALLEQVRAEQRLEAAVRQAEDLDARQGQINEGAAREEQGDRLAQQEDALQQDTGRLQQELKELARSLESMSPGTSGQLDEQAAAMETHALTGRMGEMSRQLRAEANTAARRLGAGLEQELGELATGLRQLQGEFVAEQKGQLSDELRQAVRDLVGLSLEQERLHDETRQLPGPDGTRAARQYALMQGVGKVAERTGRVARRTLSLHPAALATIGHALRQMQDAATALADPDALPPLEQQTAAMAYLNEAALQLRESLDNLAQARMPSSFGEAMQKLLGLSEQQARLNQATQQSLGLGLQSGRDGRARIDRLAAQQRRILEALQQLQREVRGHRGAEERLGVIEREMAAVAGELERRRVEPRTTAAQQRLLQRMLDASRSIHTQGEDEEKRQSTTGTDRAFAGPSWLPADLGQTASRLREALKQALEGPYPEEYRPPIRQYFEGLYEDTEAGKEAVR